jgi:hypothetical protein
VQIPVLHPPGTFAGECGLRRFFWLVSVIVNGKDVKFALFKSRINTQPRLKPSAPRSKNSLIPETTISIRLKKESLK